MKKISFLLVVLLLVGCQVKEVEVVQEVQTDLLSLEDIQADKMMSTIDTLASQAYDGRHPASAGNKLTEAYIVDAFKSYGLVSPEGMVDYKQAFEHEALYPEEGASLVLEGSDKTYKNHEDYKVVVFSGSSGYDGDFSSEIVEITSQDQLMTNAEALEGKALLVDHKLVDRAFYKKMSSLKSKVTIPAVFMSASDDSGFGYGGYYSYKIPSLDYKADDPIYFVCKSHLYKDLLTHQSRVSGHINYDMVDVKVNNLIGILPGKNEDGKNEVVVIGAHLDHIGSNFDGTYNPGALDNASGIAVMLEMARIMSTKEQADNTLVFMAFNSEELGLLGSKYLVKNMPLDMTKDNTVMFNLDMVGSSDESPLIIAISNDSGKGLQEEAGQLASTLGIEYKFEKKSNSDHASFAGLSIPAIQFNHFDERYYHTYKDTLEASISEQRLIQAALMVLESIEKEVYH